MRFDKKLWLAIAAGIFLIMSSLLSGEALAEELDMLNGEVGMNKIILLPSYKDRHQENKRIELEVFQKLKEKLGSPLISCSVTRKAVAEAGGNSIAVVLNAVDASFVLFNSMSFVKGGFWSMAADTEAGRAAVLDTDAAIRLFGSTDVAGMTLGLGDRKYRIVGVLQKKTSPIGRLFRDGSCHIYIPLSALEEDEKEAWFTEVQIAAGKDGKMEKDEVEAALLCAGEKQGKYDIVDFRKKRQQLEQKSRIVVFLLGFLTELMLFRLIKKITIESLFLIKKDCKTDYLQNSLKKRYKKLLANLVGIMVLFFTMLAIGCIIRFDLYIPANMVPDELTDLTFYVRLLESRLQVGMENLLQYKTVTGIQFARMDMLQSFTTAVLAPLGLILLRYGFTNNKSCRSNIVGTVFFTAVVFLAAVLVWVTLSISVGLPVFMDKYSLSILWAYIFFKIITAYLKEEEKNVKTIHKSALSGSTHFQSDSMR